MSFYAPDCTFESAPLGTRFRRVAAIRDFHADWLSVYDELAVEFDEVLDQGNGVILAVARQTARPVGSTGRVSSRLGFIFEWADGTVAHVMVHYDIEEARAVAERVAEERG